MYRILDSKFKILKLKILASHSNLKFNDIVVSLSILILLFYYRRVSMEHPIGFHLATKCWGGSTTSEWVYIVCQSEGGLRASFLGEILNNVSRLFRVT